MPPKGFRYDKPEPEGLPFMNDAEYKDFIAELAKYHEKRGTSFEQLPKVGSHYINLLQLYKRVVEEGGYDLCSDTRAKPLMWRAFAEELVGKSKFAPAQAFQVKQVYYKQLAAYEISTHWKKEPPPKEILEDLTAKGGGIMIRTFENFARPSLGGAPLDDAPEDEGERVNGTPQESDPMDLDIPDSATAGRSTRGLRQAPPQRVLFQPDTVPGRTRKDIPPASTSPTMLASAAAVNHFAQPAPTLNVSLANYEPRQSYALPLKPVTTPANNPDHYRRLKRQRLEDASSAHPMVQRMKGVMLPGTGFAGPNIYVRAQLALQSGLIEEQEYALHHLVKISHERGDKYRFDQFPGLAEALINKMLQVTGLYYDREWSVSYCVENSTAAAEQLDGLQGTSDIFQKLSTSKRRYTNGQVRSKEFSDKLRMITEAALVVRNLCMLDENARYVSKVALLKDYICVVLAIDDEDVNELQYYALETLEQLSTFLRVDSKDPVYQSLLSQLQQQDRGKLATALRTVARLGMSYPENKKLDDVPPEVLQNVCTLLVLEDDELRSSCLDFLFQFSNVADQVDVLIRSVDGEALVIQLTSLLLNNAKEETKREKTRKDYTTEEHATKVPKLATELIEQLIKFEEPERSSHWLRMCFQDDSQSEVTQIDLWKSYQGTFSSYSKTHPHLIAGDFIKNVSNTFTGASAQVAPGTKYVIRGIRPRLVPIDYRGRKLLSCKWRNTASVAGVPELPTVFANSTSQHCGIFFPSGISLLEHILSSHMGIPHRAVAPEATAGTHGFSYTATVKKFDFSLPQPHLQTHCGWSTCQHSIGAEVHSDPRTRTALLGRHIQTHLPDGMPTAEAAKNGSVGGRNSAPWTWLNTYTDERNDAGGTPLGACLVLRNIARGINKMSPAALVLQASPKAALNGINGEANSTKKDEALEVSEPNESSKSALIKKLFYPVKDRLFYAMAYNQVMKDHLSTLLKCISQGTAMQLETKAKADNEDRHQHMSALL